LLLWLLLWSLVLSTPTKLFMSMMLPP